MFKALGRLIRTIGYILTGRFNRIADVWGSNPHVINATFDQIAQEKLRRIRTAKDALAGHLRFRIAREERLKQLAADIKKQEAGMAGAMTKGKQRAAQLAGKAPEEIKLDVEYTRCSAAYNDFKSTLDAKKTEAATIEAELKRLDGDMAQGQAAIESMIRDLEQIQKERADTVYATQAAAQRKELADLKSGLGGTEGASGERQRMKELRSKLETEATVAERLAGVESNAASDEFTRYAEQAAAANEFDQLLGVVASPAPQTELSQIAAAPLPET